MRKWEPDLIKADRKLSHGNTARIVLARNEDAVGDLISTKKMERLIGGLERGDDKNQGVAE